MKTVEFPVRAMDGHIQISGSSLFWWSGGENRERIRRTSCSPFGNDCSTSTIYAASAGTQVIGLAANSEAAFWVEDVSLGPSRLRRKSLNGGQATTLTEQVLNSAPSLDVDGVYFQSDNRTISRLPFDTAAITGEIGVNGWEVTQGMQRPANDNPLVAGKTTFVRLYPTLEVGANLGAVFAELHGSRNGQPLPGSPIYPLNRTIAVGADLSLADRGRLDSGWLFRLPQSWTRTGDTLIPQEDTTITLRAVIDPFGAYANTDDPNNNEIRGDFMFTTKAPTCMTMWPILTEVGYESVKNINVAEVVELTESILPTPKIIAIPINYPLGKPVCQFGAFPVPCHTAYELNEDASDVLNRLEWIAAFASNPPICAENNARTLSAGIVHPDANWGSEDSTILGVALTDQDQLLTRVPRYGESIDRLNQRAMTMVHEIGHNYGRLHIDCGEPDDTDPDYKPGDMLDASLPLDSPDLHFGFDPLAQSPISPRTNADFMSYCDPSWYSGYTWKGIFNMIRDPRSAFISANAASSAGDIVRVAGLIDREDNSGTLDYAWKISAGEANKSLRQKWLSAAASALDNNSIVANYHLQLIGSNGQILTDQAVELIDIVDGHQDGPQPFELILDAPAEAVSRLQLMADETVIATLAPGSSEPTIVINEPTGGSSVNQGLTIGWTASDLDGDQLLYTVQYSPNNGEEWYPLLVNYDGTGLETETVTLDISAEPGSNGANALVRVLVTDGYNTSIATSPPFTVVRRQPLAAITSPAEDQTFAAGDTISLQGFAGDPEDGLIADAQFVWSTGQTGQMAEVDGLAPGTHALQLSVTDSHGLDGTGNVSFNVAPLAVPETTGALTLDGRCDDAGYQSAPQLPLTSYANGLRADARLIHTSSSMWLCLANLQSVDGYVGMLLDSDNSGEVTVQRGDFGYYIQQDGTHFRREGNGGGFDTVSANNFAARIYDNGTVWSAEFMIGKSAFGDWQKRVSLVIGHFEQTGGGASIWPRSADMTSPNSWGQTNLGLVSALTSITPESAILGAGDIALTAGGINFDSDSVVIWNNVALSTTLVDTTTVTAIVPAGLVTGAGIYGVSVGIKDQESLTTAVTPFTVNNPQPAITKITPSSTNMGSGDMTVSIVGDGFVDGAAVIWAGEMRTTNFVSATELRISLTAAELTATRNVPLVVVNPEPNVGPSNTAIFTILPETKSEQLFLPLIGR